MILIEELPSVFQYHKSSKQLNLQAITLWVTKEKFVIQPNLNRSRIPTILEIHRQTKIIKEIQNYSQAEKEKAKPNYFSCLIGILNLNGKKIMVLGEEVNLIGSIGQRDIFKITKPIYLFYDSKQKQGMTDLEAELLFNITSIFEEGMYFSYCYDLALRLNSSTVLDQEKSKFNWASSLQSELLPMDPSWRLSIIQGFVGKIQIHINGEKIFITLISRRAVNRGGTQYFARGLDEAGNAGNYVETEQIITLKDYYFSYLQCRGTAPLFWNQDISSYGFTSIKIQKTRIENYLAFKKQVEIIHQRGDFKEITLLNLMNSQNEEKKLIQNYQYLVRELSKENKQNQTQKPNIKYGYFDVHSICGNKNYSKLNEFLEKKIIARIKDSNFTALKIDRVNKKLEILKIQNGIVRTNCRNCIDRTNIAQSRIAALKLIEMINYLEIDIAQFKKGLAFLSTSTPFSNLYRNLWADNGDALSKQYTGTGSTESFAVRKGKLSYLTMIDHGIKSLNRVIRNIRSEDIKKQEALGLILGQTLSSENEMSLLPDKLDQVNGLSTENQDKKQYEYRQIKDT